MWHEDIHFASDSYVHRITKRLHITSNAIGMRLINWQTRLLTSLLKGLSRVANSSAAKLTMTTGEGGGGKSSSTANSSTAVAVDNNLGEG